MHRYRSTCMDKGVLSCLLSGGGHQKPDWLQEEHHGPVGRGQVVPLRAGDCALQGAHAVNPDNHRCLFFDLHDPICPSPDHTHLQLLDDCNLVHVPVTPFMSFEWMCNWEAQTSSPSWPLSPLVPADWPSSYVAPQILHLTKWIKIIKVLLIIMIAMWTGEEWKWI